jgi:hypothetical protein
MKKKIAFAIMCLGLFSFMFASGLDSYFVGNRPIMPNISGGQVFPLNVHGTVVYLTHAEETVRTWMLVGGLALAVVAAAFRQYFGDK